MGSSIKNANIGIERRLADAACNDDRACYELGMVYSTGTSGVALDLIEAHKWFNLVAVSGNIAARECRAEIAEDMTGRDWMQFTQRRAA
jgi:TPR repeat protein